MSWPPPLTVWEQEKVLAALNSGRLTDGPWTEAAEDALAGMVGARCAVAFSSCTAAIHAALAARDVGQGSRVAAPSWTFVGTWTGAAHLGAEPVLVDVDWDQHTVVGDVPDGVDAAVAVDLHGAPHGWNRAEVVTDACQALGTEGVGRGGTHCWSFSSAKGLPAPAGGAVTTDDVREAVRLRHLRDYGLQAGEARAVGDVIERAGHNWRPTEPDMALVASRLQTFPERWWPRMRSTGERLRRAAEEAGWWVQTPPAGVVPVWHKIRVGAPVFVNRLIVEFERRGVAVHRWGRPLGSMRAWRQPDGHWPVAADLFAHTVCLGTESEPFWTWPPSRVDHTIEVLSQVAARLELG